MTRHPLPPNKLINLILLWTEGIDLYELHTVINALQHCISQLFKQRSPVHEILQYMFSESTNFPKNFLKECLCLPVDQIYNDVIWYIKRSWVVNLIGKLCVEELNK